ncbi:hypothetical protein [Leifsonia sp. Leaf264]|uniref:hypothetical protein n=1 Tax=Leifsonia sp. Leaf264 TaxID=1736314 RepID=UPI000AA1EA35|nr:hypothetical protein [Leifsonia sp. Leaf264]
MLSKLRTRLSLATDRRLTAIADTRGSSITDAVGATIIAVIVMGVVATMAVSSMTAITQFTSDSERIQDLTALTSNPGSVPAWETAITTEITEPRTLPSGTKLDARLWADKFAGGIRYTAALPKSGYTGTACTTRTAVPATCLYSSNFVATDTSRLPLRSALSSHVDWSDPVPARTTIATSATPSGTAGAGTPLSLWRYYIDASAVGSAGQIQIVQNRIVIATIPVTTTPTSYFGTLVLRPGYPATIVSYDRDMDINDVLIYKAGTL